MYYDFPILQKKQTKILERPEVMQLINGKAAYIFFFQSTLLPFLTILI
jgi:hypothetical protein